jgi:hypothetical protein
MIRKFCFALTIVAGLVFVSDSALARVKVTIDFDKAFDFTAVRTWSFDPSGYGVVKMARTREDSPASAKELAEPIIIDAVNVEMKRLKLQPASDRPDLIVRYFLFLSTNQTAQTMGQFLPGTVSWGLPPFAQSTQSLEVMNQGALVLDLAAGGNVVWRGVAQSKIDMGLDLKKREAMLREAIRDLLKKFPPKK